jgi:rod shape-determining protein MreD
MIARQLTIACVIYLALILQPSLGDVLGQIGYMPWLPGIAVMACAGLTGGTSSLVCSALVGLGIDCLSEGKLGIHMVSATLMATMLMILQFSRRRHLIVIALFAFTVTFLWRNAAGLAHGLAGHQTFEVSLCVTHAATSGVATTALLLGMIVIYRALITGFWPHSARSVSLSNHWSMLSSG